MSRLWAVAGGFAYAVLAVVGILLLVQDELDSASDDEILSHYTDSGTRTTEIVGFVLVAIAAAFLVWFVSALASRLREHSSTPASLSATTVGAGVGAAVLLVSAAALLSSTSFGYEISDRFAVDVGLARFAVIAGYVLLVGAAFFGAALILAASVAVLRTSAFPRWFGWAGLVIAALAIVEAFLLPVFVVPVWVLVASVILLRGDAATVASGSAATGSGAAVGE